MLFGKSTTITYIGGPTVLIDFGGLRFLTDPTFDPSGSTFSRGPNYTLEKTEGPAVDVDRLGDVDVVLLSHDHHYDNLDDAGRAMLGRANRVLTTLDGAERLGGNAEGLIPWQSVEIGDIRLTATPARHGPEGGDRGPVVGFMLEQISAAPSIYVTGDTVLYDGVEEVGGRYNPDIVVLFLGAAKVAVAGPSHLTFTAEEGVQVARLFEKALIVPVHYAGWKHFTEGRTEVDSAFAAAGLAPRLRWLDPGARLRFSKLPLGRRVQ
jgi:L-ascorbate metabolism protein UlaG (beta-lactamase superfamily)